MRSCAENGFGVTEMSANGASFIPVRLFVILLLGLKDRRYHSHFRDSEFARGGDIRVVRLELFELITLFLRNRHGELRAVWYCLRVGNTCDRNELQGSR